MPQITQNIQIIKLKMQKSEIFKASLLRVMKDKGISPSELARMMGTSPSTVSRWIAGSSPHARTLDRLEKTLRTTLLPATPDNQPVTPEQSAAAVLLFGLDMDTLSVAVKKANSGLLMGAMLTGLRDILDYRLPFDNQITDKLQVILTELTRRAPAATGYTPPIKPNTRITQP